MIKLKFSEGDRKKYEKVFKKFGIDSLEDLAGLQDDDWEDLEVKTLHKRKILAAISKK